jgi:hypothetical protein
MPLTSSRARAVITAAEAKASAMGVPVIITTVDAGVHLKALTRMDGAVLASIDIALEQARTAALFQPTVRPSGNTANRRDCPGLELTNGGLEFNELWTRATPARARGRTRLSERPRLSLIGDCLAWLRAFEPWRS